MGQHSHLNVLENGEPVEDVDDLKRAANSPLANLVRRQSADLFSLEDDLSLIRLQLTADEIKQGGLASAVGTDHRHQLTLRNGEVSSIDRHKVPEGFVYSLYLQHLSVTPFPLPLQPEA